MPTSSSAFRWLFPCTTLLDIILLARSKVVRGLILFNSVVFTCCQPTLKLINVLDPVYFCLEGSCGHLLLGRIVGSIASYCVYASYTCRWVSTCLPLGQLHLIFYLPRWALLARWLVVWAGIKDAFHVFEDCVTILAKAVLKTLLSQLSNILLSLYGA